MRFACKRSVVEGSEVGETRRHSAEQDIHGAGDRLATLIRVEARRANDSVGGGRAHPR
jgi:hypothetical protein